MTANAARTSRETHEFRRAGMPIWFGIFGAPAAWIVSGALGVVLGGTGCYPTPAAPQGFSPGAVRGAAIVIVIVALIVALAAFLVGLSAWRRSPDPGVTAMHVTAQPDFLAATALLVSFVFTLAILITGFSVLSLSPCESVR